MLKRLYFLLLIVLTGELGWAQNNRFVIQLEEDSLDVQWVYTESLNDPKEEIVIHIPIMAYIDKGSFLNNQLREFQDPDLHFARKRELAYFNLKSANLNGEELELDIKSENLVIKTRMSRKIDLVFNFKMKLPDQKFTGNGKSKWDLRIIDLLPRVTDSLKTLSYYYDTPNRMEDFDIQISSIEEWDIKSNLTLVKSSDNSYHFQGRSRSVQFFCRPQWFEYELGPNAKLYLEEEDPNFYANFRLALEETGSFFKNELNDSLSKGLSFIFLDKKKGEYQSADLLSLERPKDWLDLRYDMVQAQAEAFFRYREIDSWRSPWLARGIPYFYKYHFIERNYPQKRWIPFQSPILNGLFGFDEFDYGYQNRFLFLFLQRQGLDQALNSPVDSLSRLNYEAISQAKTFLLLSHLRAYVGEKNFKRSMARYLESSDSIEALNSFKSAFNYYSNQPLNWFFGPALKTAEIYDYQIEDYEHCPTVSTATIQNTGDTDMPYSITGYKDGEAVLSQWYSGHEGERTVQLYHEEYDKVVVNAHLNHAEYRQKNNTYYNRWLLPRMEPLSFQLYNSFEAAEATQIFYVPSLYYNAYDRFLLGINLSNRSILVQKPFEYTIVPEYSTGTGKITGTASAAYTWITPKNAFFRQIRFGVYGRYNHYDRDLAFFRFSPSVNFRIRKKYPRSPYIQSLRLRSVVLNRELDANAVVDQGAINTASYTVFNANYRLEYTSLLRPTIFRFHFEAADQFTKLFAEYDQRWMLPNKKWLILRAFAGGFLYNELYDQGFRDNYYSLGLSGTPDYLFDYYFIGRSDESGIWANQFFTTDGGFRTETDAFADRFLLSTNLSVPIYGPLGVFGDVGISEEQTYWDYGIRLALLTDFLEFYFPLQNQDRNFTTEHYYLSNVRFVLDLKLGNIINRVRRGFY